ncbi:MAG: hypothetical protein U1D55_10175 [Phycisphaerae bacterium]
MPKGKQRAVVAGGGGGMRGAISGLQGYRNQLIAQRGALDAQISAIENALAAIGVKGNAARSVGPRAGGMAGKAVTASGRAVRSGSLKDFICRVLSGRGVMSVKDITTGVRSAGFKSKNKTLSKSVGIALTELPGVNRMGRGRFRMG